MLLKKRIFLQNNKQYADLLKVFKLPSMTVWVYKIKPEYVGKIRLNHGNIGITVPKTISKKAVVRNKIKRKIRNFFMPFLKANKELFVWVRVRKIS